MEKIDRIARHSDYPALLSYSPRKQAAASAPYTVYQFAIQSSRSLECSLKLLHPNLVLASFAQFRMNARIPTHAGHTQTHPFPISLFRKSPRLSSPRGDAAVAAQPGFVVPVVSSAVRYGEPGKRAAPMEGRYIRSDRPLLPRHIESANESKIARGSRRARSRGPLSSR
jgi:hypothetical protein